MNIPKVTLEQTEAFSKQWNINGVAIFQDKIHLQFATDWANIVLVSFINNYIKQQQEAVKPKVTLE